MRITDNYVFFYGGPFSQWHKCKFSASVIDTVPLVFTSAEQYMMACKARFFVDAVSFQKIMRTNDPSICKALGRSVKNFNKARWNANAREFVYQGNLAKFQQNEAERRVLLGTGNRTIVEGSPTDNIWGVGLHYTDPLIDDPANWRGTNWLGEVLERVRTELKNV